MYYVVVGCFDMYTLFRRNSPSGPRQLLCQGFVIRRKTSGRGIGPSQTPLPDKTQHSQQRDVHALGGLEPVTPARDPPQNHTLNRAATVIGCIQILYIFLMRR